MVKCPMIEESVVETPLCQESGDAPVAVPEIPIRIGSVPDVVEGPSIKEEQEGVVKQRDGVLEKEQAEKGDRGKVDSSQFVEKDEQIANGGDGHVVEPECPPKKGRCPDVKAIQSTEEEHKMLLMRHDQELEKDQKEKEERERADLMRLMEGNRLLANEKVWKTVKWIGVIIAAVWLLSHLVSLISVISTSVGATRYVAMVCVTVLVVVCLLAGVLFCRVFRSLPRFAQSIKKNDGKIVNEDKLRSYVASLGEMYHQEGSYRKVVSEKAEEYLRNLQTKDFGGIRDSWIACFEKMQEEQVKRAKQCVASYAKMVGVGTATCPWKAGDVYIVFSGSIALVVEIARIFNRIDVNRYVAFRLIRGWLSEMYIAGHLQDVTELAVSKVNLTNGTAEVGEPETWADILGTFAEPLKKVLGKVSEGAVNGLLCYRFGKMAIREFSQLRYESEVRK